MHSYFFWVDFLVIKRGVFDADVLYKHIYKKILGLGYIFAEQEQKAKPNQYGKTTTAVFLGFKDIDDFCKGRIIVTMTFENLNKIKTDKGIKDTGNISILFEGKIILDFENKWDKTQFKIWLLNTYIKYFKTAVIKKNYIKPVAKELTKLYDSVKEKLEMY